MARSTKMHVTKAAVSKASTTGQRARRHRQSTPLSPSPRHLRIPGKGPSAVDTAPVGLPCRVCFKRMVDPFAVCEKGVGRKVCNHCSKGNSRCPEVSSFCTRLARAYCIDFGCFCSPCPRDSRETPRGSWVRPRVGGSQSVGRENCKGW